MSTQFWTGLAIGLLTGGTVGWFINSACALAKAHDAHFESSADDIIDLTGEPPSIAPGRWQGRWPADRFYREKDNNDRPRH